MPVASSTSPRGGDLTVVHQLEDVAGAGGHRWLPTGVGGT
ncbi:MAG: hypothetical protein AVDCRST_MAG06-131 [uncultured Nocardioides sp.]|uniref:Uncharacterized protein n=1 Tax=uncultured Nocardioides sp. TaxID=198441 RepID=A0A6J4N3B9_9ACTN|nr:MAG: hypothetical protein AVDCRST_MAG06-131 [uncultured Nocardioides sp.]